MHASRPSDENEEKFKIISQAYEILSNDELREIYDREGIKGVDEHKERLKYEDFGYPFSGPEWGGRKQKSAAYRHKISAPLEDFYFGKVRRFRVTRDVICPACQRSGN